MAKQTVNNIRLGLFVATGLLILIVALYVIGKNSSMFGSNFTIRARFHNVNGLQSGNNVRFAGIQAGTVKEIHILSDTSVEVTILLEKKIKPYVRKNAIATIGNEGLMGNKVINIYPGKTPAPEIENDDILQTRQVYSTEEMMQILSNTNTNVEVISEQLKEAVTHINKSTALWNTLDDTTIAPNLSTSLKNIRMASDQVNAMAGTLNTIVKDMNEGKGTLGKLLKDETIASDLKEAMQHINTASEEAKNLIANADSIVQGVQQSVKNGPGAVHNILNDPDMANKLQRSMDNIEKGIAAFNEDMEALKHNFLTRGYFRKMEKKSKKEKK